MATGSSSVSEVLSKGGEQSNGEHATLDTVNLPTMATAPGTELNVRGSPETSKGKRRKAVNADAAIGNTEIALPPGKELTTVNGVVVPAQDTGNALQLSEFCSVFGEILNFKKNRAKHVLQDIYHGQPGRRAKVSTTVQLYIDLLSTTKKDQGEKSSESTLSGTSWFNVLKECLPESREVLATHGLVFDELTNFETLNASGKLSLLNVLCDEILGTDKVRNWIKEQSEKFAGCVKEAKQKLKSAKDEEENLKLQQVTDIVAALEANNGAPLSAVEHEVIVSRLKPDMIIARDKVLESKRLILTDGQYPDAVRAEAILIDQGQAYWKLNSLGKANMLCQKIGRCDDTDTRNEEWLVIDFEGEKLIEKHDHFLRKKRKAEEKARRKALKEHRSREEADSIDDTPE